LTSLRAEEHHRRVNTTDASNSSSPRAETETNEPIARLFRVLVLGGAAMVATSAAACNSTSTGGQDVVSDSGQGADAAATDGEAGGVPSW
jgi:hypothetical protein